MTIRQDIYAALDKMLEPAALPAPWHRLTAPPDYRARMRDFQVAVDLLRQSFSEVDLVSAGVICRSRSEAGEATTSINPGLVLGNLLLLRRDIGEPPYEIVSAAGCISGSEPPLLAALHDAATQRLFESFGKTLFATFTIQDTAILRGLGFPAMAAAGLQKLHGHHFEEFCAVFDVRPLGRAPSEDEEDEQDEDKEESTDDTGLDGDHPCAPSPPPPTSPMSPPELQPGGPEIKATSPHPKPSAARSQPAPPPSAAPRQATAPQDIKLCFVAWQLAQLSLDEPEKLAAVDAHLRELAGHLDLLMDQIFVWRPAPDLPQKLRCALNNNLLKHVKRLVRSSCSHSQRTLILRDPAPPSQPLTIREVWEPLQLGGDRQDIHRAANVQDFERMIFHEVTVPFLERAEALTDPAEKARALVEAHCASQQLRLLPQLGLGAKAPRTASNGLLRPEDADRIRSIQKSLSDFLGATNPAPKKSSR